jgi:hypothetical protein
MKDIMLDIETLGTAPGAPIVQIAAKQFSRTNPDTDWLALNFECRIDLQSCLDAGLTDITAGTLEFWFNQDPATAARVLFDDNFGRKTILEACAGLHDYARECAAEDGCDMYELTWWAKGPDFDMGLIADACSRFNLSEPWKYSKKRDLRTLQDISGMPDDVLDQLLPPPQEQHDAMIDVEFQIDQVRRCLRQITVEEHGLG